MSGWRHRAAWRSIGAARRAYLAELAAIGLRLAAGAGLIATALIAAPRAPAPSAVVAGFGLGAALLAWGVRSWGRARRLGSHARACAEVKRALAPLAEGGWTLTHSQSWPGGRRLDFLVISPDRRLGFVIACVSGRASNDALHLAHEAASWLGTTTRGYAPLIAVAGASGVERTEAGVACISPDRLGAALDEGWAAFLGVRGERRSAGR